MYKPLKIAPIPRPVADEIKKDPQSLSLIHYTQDSQNRINDYLRYTATSPEYKDIKDHIKNINGAFKNTLPHEGGRLSRGFYIPNKNKYKKDRTYIHKGYLSTTTDKRTAHNFSKPEGPEDNEEDFKRRSKEHSYVMHINVPANHPVVNLSNLSHFPEEKEHLLPHNTKFKVTNVIKRPNHTEVYADVLPIKPKKKL